MQKSRPLTLLSGVGIVLAVLSGVALLTIGSPLLSGGVPTRQAPPTTITLTTSPPSPVVKGTPVTLTAMITPTTAVGTVQFKDGANNLGNPVTVSNGTASGPASSLASGAHSLSAVFAPANTAAYAPSTSPTVMFLVTDGAVTTTTLSTSPPSPVAQNTPVTLTAMITPTTAVGTVQFKDGANNLGNPVIVSNGTATGSTSTLNAGPHQLVAVFTPADPAAFGPSTSSPVAFEVTAPSGPVATTTTLTTSPSSPVAQGTPVTLTATITPPTAAGTVQFRDGTTSLGNPVTVSNGVATGSTSSLAAGSHSLTAVFVPTAQDAFSPSTTPPLAFVVNSTSAAGGAAGGAVVVMPTATATSTTLTTNPVSPVRRDTKVTLNATITPATAGGTVQFKDGAINLGNPAIVSNGTASTTTSTLAVGGHQLTAVFTPTAPAVFSPSTSPAMAFEVTDPALADLEGCLRVRQTCPELGDPARSSHPVTQSADPLVAARRLVIVRWPTFLGGP